MASSMSEQDELNHARCLATCAGKIRQDGAILPAQDYQLCPAISLLKPYNKTSTG